MLPLLPRRSGWAYCSLIHPAVPAFPERVVGSACALSFSRLAQRSLTLRPAHSRCHQFVTRFPKASASSLPPWLLRLLPAGAFAGWDLHPLESAALSRRTPETDLHLCRATRSRPRLADGCQCLSAHFGAHVRPAGFRFPPFHCTDQPGSLQPHVRAPCAGDRGA
jgi:hypothetical protein